MKNSTVEKKHRIMARRKRKEFIRETIEARKGPREINKHRNKQVMMSTRKESADINSGRKDILRMFTEFCK